MGQKIHPVGFRLGVIKEHQSRWYADPKKYPATLMEDHLIRTYIPTHETEPEKKQNLSKAGIALVRIERKADQVDVEIHTNKPGIVVGKGGNGIESLRNALNKLLGGNRQVRINVLEIQQPDANAVLIAEYIVGQLEKRVSFRRIVRQALDRAQKAGVKGIKVQVSGRLNGAEIARTEWTREGRVPLHTLRADIDYAYRTAQTIYGILGVKVWIFKGEIIPGQEEIPTPAPSAPPRRPKQNRPTFEDRSEK